MTSTQTISAFTRVAYPGALGIPPVGVAFDIPEGWTTGSVTGALAVAREPIAVDGFWANVVLSIDRVRSTTTLDKVASGLLDDTREESSRFAIAEERVVDAGGVPGILREQTVEVEETPLTLVQFVLVLLVDVPGVDARDCVQITGSIGESRRDRLAEVFDRLVQTLELGFTV